MLQLNGILPLIIVLSEYCVCKVTLVLISYAGVSNIPEWNLSLLDVPYWTSLKYSVWNPELISTLTQKVLQKQCLTIVNQNDPQIFVKLSMSWAVDDHGASQTSKILC
jgi:hypothetical protein